MTFKEYVERVAVLLAEHPDWEDLPMFQCEHWEAEEVCLPEKSNGGYFPEDVVLI